MGTKHKNIIIGALLVIVLIMAVGYAAFATQLNINSNVTITSTWDVHIKSITAQKGAGTAEFNTNPEGVTGVNAQGIAFDASEDPLSASFYANLISPGDSITYTIIVENSGSLKAKLSQIDFKQGTQNGEQWTTGNAMVYTHTASTNTTINPEGTYQFTVTVTYKSSIQTQPANNDLQSVLDLHLTYVQDTSANS